LIIIGVTRAKDLPSLMQKNEGVYVKDAILLITYTLHDLYIIFP